MPTESTASETAADLPPSDTMEPLPDGFWDAVPEHARRPPRASRDPGRAAAEPAAAAPEHARTDAAAAAPPPPAPSRPPDTAAAAAEGAEGGALARLRRTFGGRLLAIEPHPEASSPDGDDAAASDAGERTA